MAAFVEESIFEVRFCTPDSNETAKYLQFAWLLHWYHQDCLQGVNREVPTRVPRKMGTNSISFSLGRGAKSGPVGKIGFGIKAPQKAIPISAVFGADDSDTEEQEVADHNAKRQRLESSGSCLARLVAMRSIFEKAHLNIAESAELFGTREAFCREQASTSKNCAVEHPMQLSRHPCVCVVG